ncbi:MAG: 3-isopropylmalate dehydratase small subunit [Opitutaceae bacterium]|jgi:3-isopropylmalate/(R)-2-methylmalate dehydratase small subunit|nr:3-isopropylmalate dehydratase small subunit [Opitutaceae bacterium]
MSLEKITQITGRGVYVPGNDIDTDRIIPARYMKCVTFDGLGEFLFYDVRHTPEGKPVVPAHPIDKPEHKGATILLTGANFGCGSSREHAPQALHKAGIRAIIAENFAEIFFGNSTTLGIPCVNAKREDIAQITAAIEADPQQEITIDEEKLEVRFGDRSIPVTQRESARDALVNGRWDAIGELLEGKPGIDALAATLAYMNQGLK